MVGFNRRFSPMARELRDFLGGAGPWTGLARINAGALPPGHWLLDPLQGGGRLLGEACHFIDLFTFLFQGMPVSVRAEPLPGGSSPDDAQVVVRYADGSLATIAYHSGGDSAAAKEWFQVTGGGRMAELEDFRRLDLWQAGRRRSRRSLRRQDKGHRAAWEAFASAVLRGGPPPIPYEQLSAVSLAAIACREALASGEVVTITAATGA
jgi:predicted dehydrogenase